MMGVGKIQRYEVYQLLLWIPALYLCSRTYHRSWKKACMAKNSRWWAMLPTNIPSHAFFSGDIFPLWNDLRNLFFLDFSSALPQIINGSALMLRPTEHEIAEVSGRGILLWERSSLDCHVILCADMRHSLHDADKVQNNQNKLQLTLNVSTQCFVAQVTFLYNKRYTKIKFWSVDK